MHHLIPRAAVAVTLCAAAGAAEARPVSFGESIALRSDHGTYLTAESDGAANTDRTAVGGWERWTIVDATGAQGGSVDAGVSSSLGPIEGSFGAGGALVFDPSDPFVYAGGSLDGMGELTVI